MCAHGTSVEIEITRRINVDSCIAAEIVELNRQGVYTSGCCCGHGETLATATILPSAAARARELGYSVRWNDGGDPFIELGSGR